MNKIWYLYHRFILAIKDVLRNKWNIYFKMEVERNCKSFIPPLRVNGPTRVTANTVLGKNTSFNGLQIKGKGRVTIGDNFHSGPGCLFLTSFHNYNGSKIPYDESTVDKDIVIEDNVWLGENVTILGGVTIGEGAIIQVGSVVVADVPKYAIAGGHPAKVFSRRNQELYEKLKEEKKFH